MNKDAEFTVWDLERVAARLCALSDSEILEALNDIGAAMTRLSERCHEAVNTTKERANGEH